MYLQGLLPCIASVQVSEVRKEKENILFSEGLIDCLIKFSSACYNKMKYLQSSSVAKRFYKGIIKIVVRKVYVAESTIVVILRTNFSLSK